MSLDRIYKIPIADVPVTLPVQTVLVATDATDNAYLVGDGGFTDWDLLLTASIVGSWDSSTGLQEGEEYDTNIPPNVIGTPTHPVTVDYASWIRPLGNDAGRATGLLDSMRWAGHIEEKFLFEDNRYTPTDSPFTLEIIRQDYGSTALPWDVATVYATGEFATSGGMWQSLQDGNVGNTPFGGSPFWEFINQSGPWGWVVKMLSDDPLRDITARAIGIYSDPAATAFLFTTGAFINDGKYGDVYYTECPPGNRSVNSDPVYYALLLGAAQEGIFQLDGLDAGDEATALFWYKDQDEPAEAMIVTQYGVNYGATTDDDTLFEVKSPDGYLITEILTSGTSRLVLELIGNSQDTLDPTITIYGYTTEYVIPMTWQAAADRYRSAVIGGLRDAIAVAVFFRLKATITWS